MRQITPPAWTRERDLWMVAGDTDEVLVGYARATGRPVNAAGLALYWLWWNLADVACFIDELRRPHRPTEDSAASWTYLNGCLAD